MFCVRLTPKIATNFWEYFKILFKNNSVVFDLFFGSVMNRRGENKTFVGMFMLDNFFFSLASSMLQLCNSELSGFIYFSPVVLYEKFCMSGSDSINTHYTLSIQSSTAQNELVYKIHKIKFLYISVRCSAAYAHTHTHTRWHMQCLRTYMNSGIHTHNLRESAHARVCVIQIRLFMYCWNVRMECCTGDGHSHSMHAIKLAMSHKNNYEFRWISNFLWIVIQSDWYWQ